MKTNDDGLLKTKFRRKKANAVRDNIGFFLTYREFRTLVREAGLRSSDLGYNGRNYVLARYGDTGPYAVGNCRFITQQENMGEWCLSEISKTKKRKTIRERYGPIRIEAAQRCLICRKKIFDSKIRKTCSIACRRAFQAEAVRGLSKPKLQLSTQRKIKKLHVNGLSSYKIATELGISRNTVMRYW